MRAYWNLKVNSAWRLLNEQRQVETSFNSIDYVNEIIMLYIYPIKFIFHFLILPL